MRILILCLLAWRLSPGLQAEMPVPKEGLLFPKAKAAEVRASVLRLAETVQMADKRKGIRALADKDVAEWPGMKAELSARIDKVLDLLPDMNTLANRKVPGLVPKAAIEAASKLYNKTNDLTRLGFMFFLTGKEEYARTAFEVLDTAGRAPRWGWFNWAGSQMPQIPYGILSRNAAFAVDLCWSGWNEAQRQRAIEILGERCVESYWRLVSLSPFMGLHHLRSKNQGHNAISGALIASLAIGQSLPENGPWFSSLFQTYAWLVAHDIGPAGTGLESGLPGYWSVSMQNLYTAAACLYNARGIDLRCHPSFAEATWYPIMKEATVPGVFGDLAPYPKNAKGLSGIIDHKPIELPDRYGGGSWWYAYAAAFPDSPATYFISKWFGKYTTNSAHQTGHTRVLDMIWVLPMKKPTRIPLPGALFKATDREVMFRSGYGSPHTYLSFNGDLILTSRNEILGCTAGLAWHFPWHQYAVTESALETEGHLYSPSMLVTGSFDSSLVSMMASKSWKSNVQYYALPGQVHSYNLYKKRTRDIYYVRSPNRDQVRDYFIFVDEVSHQDPRWHSFNWHIWNSPGNAGRYEVVDSRTAIARRPNASLLIKSLSHPQCFFEQQGIPSQPNVRYVFDHNALLLRAIAGKSTRPSSAKPFALPVSLWKGGKPVTVGDRKAVLFESPKGKKPVFAANLRLVPGCRYRVSLRTRKEDAKLYENFTWTLNLKLLDASGKVLLDAASVRKPRQPHPLKLTSPASYMKTYQEWKETATHFTAPAGAARIEGAFLPATWGHGTKLTPSSKIWLTDIRFEPLGIPVRKKSDRLVTLVMPLDNEDPLPEIRTSKRRGLLSATIRHPGGTQDSLRITASGHITLERKAGSESEVFGRGVTRIPQFNGFSEKPVTALFRRRNGRITAKVRSENKTRLLLAGHSYPVPRGTFLLDGGLRPDPAAAVKETNSKANQEALKKGLLPIAREIIEARDKYVSRGWKNLALGAKVTASATRDARFAAGNVIDNKTWEVPVDGVVDYRLGSILTTGNGAYGRGSTPYKEQAKWPFYVPPTYWLLPARTAGKVVLRLKSPAQLKLIRLLNTTNAGLNDFAAVRCKLSLLGPGRTDPFWSREVPMGKAHDRAFGSAFVFPKYFSSYGDSFKGILQRGVIVPFGEGWIEVPVDNSGRVGSVVIEIEKFWALGGGLNEVQVYCR